MSLRTQSSVRRYWHPRLPANDLEANIVMSTGEHVMDLFERDSAGHLRLKGSVPAETIRSLRNELDRVMDEIEAQYEPQVIS